MTVLAVAGEGAPATGQDRARRATGRDRYGDVVGLPVLPGSTRAVLLLCAQSGLAATVRPLRSPAGSGFAAWLLAEDPAGGFGFLVLDGHARVLGLQLFDGPADPRLHPDPGARADACAGSFPAVVAALAAYRRRRPSRVQDATTSDAPSATTRRRGHGVP
ncbi:MAG: hypothetical protein QG597_2910 [Actinomycetota bacterium]|nr:hypothetical protein [Actinomycetota bacterium]